MIIPGSDITVDSPDYTGTPDDWFKQATELTRFESAERIENSWYISRTKGGYRLYRANEVSNPHRLAALDKLARQQGIEVEELCAQTDPETRLLVTVNATPPPWMVETLLMARSDVDSAERVLWSANRQHTHWRQVADGRHRVSNVEMAALDPKPIIVREVDDE